MFQGLFWLPAWQQDSVIDDSTSDLQEALSLKLDFCRQIFPSPKEHCTDSSIILLLILI